MNTEKHITISAKPSEKESMNFEFLKKTGLEYIQKTAGKIWTDFNVHDPGLTILETLCYAINDLGYRTNFKIEDLLAHDESKGKEEIKNFFTAREILTNAPFTINDYRKLLIDVEGIKNAWLIKTSKSEVDFYLDGKEKEITYTKNDDTVRIGLVGLYEILIEFGQSETNGDLNDNTLIKEIEISTGALKGLEIEMEVSFSYWHHQWKITESWENLADIKKNILSIAFNIKKSVAGYDVTLTVEVDNELTVTVVEKTGTSFVNKPAIATALKKKLLAVIDPNKPDNLILKQKGKLTEINQILENGKAILNQNRNLCEDFVKYSALRIEEILLCADIELSPEIDAEIVLAEIYDLVAHFLSPDICFYSIDELLEKGETTEEIFQGPRLNHGFISNQELEKSERLKSIHVSDLINIIMEIPGVIAIKNIQIGNIPLGDKTIVSKSEKWCMDLAFEKNFVPRLNKSRSKITFFKRGIPFFANMDEVESILEDKENTFNLSKNKVHTLDLEIPKGQYFDLERYTSIQDHFPENYGIGSIGLSEERGAKRIAQAKQLKGYLLFFDQILANYCSQLSHIKNVFSIDFDMEKTYFNQPLYDIPNIEIIYKDFVENADLSFNVKNDNKALIKSQWTDFTENENNTLRQKLNLITEDKETFLKRRDQFLNHLLARFSEQFSDYALLAFKMDGKKVLEDLIEDKTAFLQEYPILSYNRGQAFDYKLPGWNNNNVSGLEKRISRLLGIDFYKRRDFLCGPPKNRFDKFIDIDEKLRFRFLDFDDTILLKSEAYNQPSGYNTGVKSVLKNGVKEEQYRFEKAIDGRYYYNLIAKNGEIIGTSNLYEREKTRNKKVKRLIAILNGNCNGEGFYLLEHLLLRPRAKEKDDFLKVNFKEPCYCKGHEDAYSFRATCIMPYWIGRFDNMDFRRFVEKTIREETPAHIFMKICWINQDQMKIFQKAYKEWLEELAKTPLVQAQLTIKQNALIDILEKARNIYPKAYLKDCQESDKKAVILGQSSLGTFTPE